MQKLQSKKIKSMNDFIVGLFLVFFGIFLMTSKSIIEGEEPTNVASYLSATTYLKLLGFLMVLLSCILIARSINFKKAKETEPFHLEFKLETNLTVIAVFFYILVLRKIGFIITTFIFTLFVVFLYMRKENEGQQWTKPLVIKKFTTAFIFSFVLVIVVYLIFTKLMLATLP
jgi:hypothetical protein